MGILDRLFHSRSGPYCSKNLKDLERSVKRFLRKRDVSGLLWILASEDSFDRTKAAEALGELGGLASPEAVSPLLCLVQDPGRSTSPRQVAILALEQIGDPSAVEPLLDIVARGNFLQDLDWQSRLALERFAGKPAVGKARVLCNEGAFAQAIEVIAKVRSIDGQLHALRTLGSESGPWVEPFLEHAFRHGNVWWPALLECFLRRGRLPVEILLSTLDGPSADSLLHHLGNVLYQMAGPDRTIARPPVADKVLDPVVDAIIALLDDQNYETRLRAAYCLEWVCSPRALTALRRAADNDKGVMRAGDSLDSQVPDQVVYELRKKATAAMSRISRRS
jgi:hypothetical protein